MKKTFKTFSLLILIALFNGQGKELEVRPVSLQGIRNVIVTQRYLHIWQSLVNVKSLTRFIRVVQQCVRYNTVVDILHYSKQLEFENA